MSHHYPRRILTPGASRKRKEKESCFCSFKPSAPAAAYSASRLAQISHPDSSNRLLAGYMAYEFLTKGTLFGQKFDPARAEAMPLCGGNSSAEPKRAKPEAEPGAKKAHQSYAEVARILKSDGTHVPGVINPTQLASWIQMCRGAT